MRQRILAGIILSLTAAASIAAPISGQGTWETTLQGRLPLTPGGTDYQAYYDTDLNITWLADADLSRTSGYDADGYMTWSAAQGWIASLNTASYLDMSDWRLPTVTDTGTPGCNNAFSGTDCGYNVDVATGEMAHMFYSTLGNTAYFNSSGNPTGCGFTCLSNTGPFSNLHGASIDAGCYWYGTENAANQDDAWSFCFAEGDQGPVGKIASISAWAVRPGDVVPVPAAVWLFGSALGVLGVMRRRAPS